VTWWAWWQALRSCGVNGCVQQAGRCVRVRACARAVLVGGQLLHACGGLRGVCVRAAGMACCMCMPCALSLSVCVAGALLILSRVAAGGFLPRAVRAPLAAVQRGPCNTQSVSRVQGCRGVSISLQGMRGGVGGGGAQLLTAPANTALPWVQLGRAVLSAALPRASSWPGPLCLIHDVCVAGGALRVPPAFAAHVECGGSAGPAAVLGTCSVRRRARGAPTRRCGTTPSCWPLARG
jgi:hypothetical protein